MNQQYETASYQVFPGIRLIYHNIHTQRVAWNETLSESVIEISHCREGRMECDLREEFCYISSGDLLVVRAADRSKISYFPLHHYHGISILMDVDLAPRCLSCFLDDVKVQPKALAEKLCSGRGCFLARSEPSFAHIFSELYSVPEEIRQGYFKIKVLELLLFLSAIDINRNETDKRALSKTQVTLAKTVSRCLTEHMEQRITLEQLSKSFHVSGTHIKNSFKAVYGVSIYAYIRTLKMESAAYMLEYTDKTILEIAGEHGYDNGSKFASAFRDVKGMTPTEYRGIHQKITACV